MITTEPTQEMLTEWRYLYDANISKLRPNRKTGFAVDEYFRSQYDDSTLCNSKFEQVIRTYGADLGLFISIPGTG